MPRRQSAGYVRVKNERSGDFNRRGGPPLMDPVGHRGRESLGGHEPLHTGGRLVFDVIVRDQPVQSDFLGQSRAQRFPVGRSEEGSEFLEGSLLKPLLYAAMIQDGELLPTELVPDIPVRYGTFAPENFDHAYEGAIPAPQALARSRNVPAVWMLRRYGVDRFYNVLERAGMRTLRRSASEYGLALIIGGAEGSLWDLTGMYRGLAWVTVHPNEVERTPPILHWRTEDAAARERPVPFDSFNGVC